MDSRRYQEWQSYIDMTPTPTSNETALIIIDGLGAVDLSGLKFIQLQTD
ncbi:MAG: hypothetical protein GY787_19450 [Alteromonadales bacterium]|nr:hypothetical protein [Alteromonadales bacterium]